MRTARTLVAATLLAAPAAAQDVPAPSPAADSAWAGRPLVVFIHGRNQPFRTTRELRDEWYGGFEDGLAKLGARDLIPDADRRFVQYEDIYEGDFDRASGCPAPVPADTLPHPGGDASLADPGGWRSPAFRLGNERVRRWVVRHGSRIPGVAAVVLRSAAEDTRDYLFDMDVRCATNRRLLAALRDARREGRPVVLVAHSMGAMVVYDVLSRFAADSFDVRGVVTMGAQLGVEPVMRYLGARGYGGYVIPAAFREWVNVRAPNDPLGFEARPFFDARNPERLPREVQIWNRPDNPHDESGYLQNSRTASAIARAWCGAFPAAGPANGPGPQPPAACAHLPEPSPDQSVERRPRSGRGAPSPFLTGAITGAIAGAVTATVITLLLN